MKVCVTPWRKIFPQGQRKYFLPESHISRLPQSVRRVSLFHRRIAAMSQRGRRGKRFPASAAKKKKKKTTVPEEGDPDFLGEEHSSVEPVDEDEDGDFDPDAATKKVPPKEKEEADDAPALVRSKRLRRRTSQGPYVSHGHLEEEGLDDDEVLVSASDQEDDDDEDEGPQQQDEPRAETVTADEIAAYSTVNIAYVNALVNVATYYRSVASPAKDDVLCQVEDDLEHALAALRDFGVPIRQAGPIEHMVPPTVPEADGSEVRFTNAAQELGIVWRDVPEDKKKQVYRRALELHREVYGCVPIQVIMHTNKGRQPVYYYTEKSYRPTMRKALLEFRAQRRKELAEADNL